MVFIGGIILAIVISILISVVSYRIGFSSGSSTSKTTYDSTLDYMTPVNDFIDKIIISEIYKLKMSYDRPENGQVFFSDLAQDQKKYNSFLIKVSILVTSYMSDNLKNAFYRIYNRKAIRTETAEKNNVSYNEDFLLSEYCIQRCIMYINDKITSSILRLENIKNTFGGKSTGTKGISEIRKMLEDETVILLGKEMQNKFNFFGDYERQNSKTN